MRTEPEKMFWGPPPFFWTLTGRFFFEEDGTLIAFYHYEGDPLHSFADEPENDEPCSWLCWELVDKNDIQISYRSGEEFFSVKILSIDKDIMVLWIEGKNYDTEYKFRDFRPS